MFSPLNRCISNGKRRHWLFIKLVSLFSLVLWRTTRTYRDFPWRSSRLIKRSFHHRLWRLPYTEVLVCHKQRVEVFHSNLSIERSWVPFRCWVSLFLTGFTSFGIRARFLVQVCLSFNIFHSFVSSLAVHITYLFLVISKSYFIILKS